MNWLRTIYHFKLALLAAIFYRFPSRRLHVIGITGTKGKSTTAELVNHILEVAGKKTVLCSTIHFKVAGKEIPNLKKMTMPGRGFIQKLLRQGLQAGCTHAVIEMTSQGVLQSRQRFIDLNALIFTNLTPEHIESHGSYEKYVQAKLKIAKALERSPKPNKILVVNSDSKEADKFLRTRVETKLTYNLNKVEDWMRTSNPRLLGQFNAYNVLAAVTLARALKIDETTIKQAVQNFPGALGRMQSVKISPNQSFEVIVDYAHTPESLEQVYQTFEGKKKICVLGGTGGGRDQWKRPVMGKIAAKYCDQIFLTDEDPYDENPRQIVEQMAAVIPPAKYQIVMDRREAMNQAFRLAHHSVATLRHAQGASNDDVVVIITGKGTDPYIMRANGAKEPWSDAQIAAEELGRLAADR